MLDMAHMGVVDKRDMADMRAPTRVVVMVRRAATANMEEAEGSMADTKVVMENVATISAVGTNASTAVIEADMVVIKLDWGIAIAGHAA